MAEHGVNDVLGDAALAEDFGSFDRMFFGVRMHLEVEVVEEPDHRPTLLISAILLGVVTHRGLDGQGVLAERFGLGVLAEDVPGVFAVHGRSLGLASYGL